MEKVGHTVDRKEGLVYRERKRDGSREDIRERKSKRVREKEGREEGPYLMSPTNNMIMMKFGGYSFLVLC